MPLDIKPVAPVTPSPSSAPVPLRPDGLDKVTGRAKFGADMTAPAMLIGKILRSPHAHARIRSIDVSKAAQACRASRRSSPATISRRAIRDLRDVLRNVMARDKVLYDGHAVAGVAATNAIVARKALKLIKVDYEILPHVTDVDAAMSADAPVLHDDIFTGGLEPKPKKPSNVAKRS